MKTQKLVMALAVGLGGGFWLSTAWAAGLVDTARGEVSVLSRDGAPRGVAKGDRVREGETILTGPDGEMLLTTDDSGVLAIRPRSRLTIEAYKVNGNTADSVVLNLLRGSLRSITGWISKTSPKNYRVTTNTATIGIRGTDHEVAIVEEGENAGTWSKVSEGGTVLSSSTGNIEQTPASNGTGRVRAGDQVPTPAPPPVMLFAPRPTTDQRLGELKQDAQTNQPARLQTRQQQVSSSGGVSPQGNPRISAQCTPDAPAQQALDNLLRAYERGDVGFLQRHIDPSMIGFGTLINDSINDANAQRQTRIQITDRQMQCGPDVAVIDFAWEKYFLASANFQPVVTRGRGSVLISGLGSGLNGQWRISGLVGDSPLRSGGVGADGTVQASPASGSYSSVPVSCNVSGSISATSPGTFPNSGNALFVITPSPSCSINVGTTTLCSIAPSPLFTLNTPATAPGINNNTCIVTTAGTITANAAIGNFQQAGTASFSGPSGSSTTVNIPVTFAGTASASGWSGNFTTSSTCTANITISPTAPATCSVVQTSVPVALELRDADVSASSLTVQVSASNGDLETFVLPQISAGVYRLNAVPISRGGAAVSPGNGRVDFVGSSTGTVVLTVRYNDIRTSTGTSTLRQTTLSLN